MSDRPGSWCSRSTAARMASKRASPVRVTKLPQANLAQSPAKVRAYLRSRAASWFVALGEQAQEEEVGDLLDGVHRVVDPAGPKDVHELIDLLTKAGGEKVRTVGGTHLSLLQFTSHDCRTSADCADASKTASRSSNRGALQAAERVELTCGEQGHVAGQEPCRVAGVVGDQAGGGIEPFLLAVAQVKACGQGIDGVGNDVFLRR